MTPKVIVIIRQPDDVRMKSGGTASFTVTVSGGTRPYHYTWKAYFEGAWHDIPDSDNAILVIDHVSDEPDNAKIACLVTDAAGNTVLSDPAELRVMRVPDTGDHAHIPAYLFTLILSAILIRILMRKRKRDV